MAQPLLEDGEYLRDESGDLEELRECVSKLEDELRREKATRVKAESQNNSLIGAMAELRRMLSPFARLLRAVNGEIEIAIGPEAGQQSASPFSAAAVGDPRWESFKSAFPGVPTRMIDALLSHGQMTYAQLAAVLHCHYDTVKAAGAKLQKAGAIVKEGTMCRLNR